MPRTTVEQSLARFNRMKAWTSAERERYEEQKEAAQNERQYETYDPEAED